MMQYQISTGNSVVYIVKGRGTNKDKFILVSRKLLIFLGNQANYKIGKSNMMQWMRVAYLPFSGIGTCAPLFVTVTGLKKRNLYRKFSLLI